MPLKHYEHFFHDLSPKVCWNEDKTKVIHTGDHTGESWIALFIDLVYVAMFINIADIIKACGPDSPQVIFITSNMFLVMFNARYSIDEFSNRFFSNDISNRLLYYFYIFGVFLMTFNIHGNDPNNTPASRRELLFSTYDLGVCNIKHTYILGFTYGFVITRVALTTLYGVVCFSGEQARQQFSIVFFVNASVLIFFILSFAYGDLRVSYMVAVTLETVGSMAIPLLYSYGDTRICLPINNLFRSKYHFPVDIYEVQHRLGIFIMMVFGESIIQLCQDFYNIEYVNKTYVFNA